MRQHVPILIYPNTPGVSLPEYCILVVLVGALCVAGLQAMGNSANNLLQGSIQQLDLEGHQHLQQQGNTLASAKSNLASDGSTLNQSEGAKNATQQTDAPIANGGNTLNQSEFAQTAKASGSGQPTLQLGTSDSSSGTNVSSSEGQQNIASDMPQELASTINTASQFDELAKNAKDPALKQYYSDLAKWTYYIGGTEGVLSNVKDLDITNKLIGANRVYSPRNALEDMMDYKAHLAKLINNPPKNVPQSVVDGIKPLAKSTLSIARSYVAENSAYINKNGTVKASINVAFAAAHPEDPVPPFAKVVETNRSYASVIGVNQLRQRVIKVLNSNDPNAQPVVSTFSNGVTIDPIKLKVTKVTP